MASRDKFIDQNADNANGNRGDDQHRNQSQLFATHINDPLPEKEQNGNERSEVQEDVEFDKLGAVLGQRIARPLEKMLDDGIVPRGTDRQKLANPLGCRNEEKLD